MTNCNKEHVPIELDFRYSLEAHKIPVYFTNLHFKPSSIKVKFSK